MPGTSLPVQPIESQFRSSAVIKTKFKGAAAAAKRMAATARNKPKIVFFIIIRYH
jgi:hypothetical protein